MRTNIVSLALGALVVVACSPVHSYVPMKTVPNGNPCDTGGADKKSGAVCVSGLCEKGTCVEKCAGPQGNAVLGCEGPF